MDASQGSYILFDVPDEVDPKLRSFLEKEGHPVVVCHGPPYKHLCPILSGRGCPLSEGAHGVIFELDLDRPQHRAILARYKESLREDLPIRVVVKPGQEAEHTELLAGLKVLTHEPTIGDLDGLAAEVEAADL